jgi:hypothetical protein
VNRVNVTMETISAYVKEIPWKETRDFAEALALFCAAGFFLYKVRTGYLIINLSLRVSCSRQTASVNSDYLVVSIELSKGDRGSILIHDAQIRITCPDEEDIPGTLDELKRYSYRNAGDRPGKELVWGQPSTTKPFLRMTPGDKTRISWCKEVPKGKPCKVELAVLGKRDFSFRYGQWRASCYSLPLED